MTVVEQERNPLELTALEVARLTRPQREQRVRDLVADANAQLDDLIAQIAAETKPAKRLVGVAVLYSGGNDSTTLAHMFRGRATHAIHANTGIGIEGTREFVRATCADWGLPLIEKHPPTGSTYEELVIDRGFPGPAHHWKMYHRLKQRALRQARAELVKRPRRERVIFLAGRRRDESDRRSDVPEREREGSIEWLSPLIYWTKLDLVTYRLMCAADGDPVPENPVSARLHMSGECLCGSFAHADELDEIGFWYPGKKAEIEVLEHEVLHAGNAPEWACRWGWGADKDTVKKMKKAGLSDKQIAQKLKRSKSGPLCSSCAAPADPVTVG